MYTLLGEMVFGGSRAAFVTTVELLNHDNFASTGLSFLFKVVVGVN